ncbi:MAG: PDZ domain-containing protein [Isosphaeraceae bacterium]|nr:PDZ domain-containing protein [Isosphaeraceae bacterium]
MSSRRKSALLPALALVVTSLAPADPVAPDVGTAYRIPYRVTDTNHFLVRVRINGKGPFNFLVDTGAPALYIGTEAAKKIGLETPEGEFWAPIDTFEFEGGAKLASIRGRIEDPFQLVGMNALGLPGATIDGILGYTILARYKIELDPTRDRMVWTRLDLEPKEPWVPRGAVAKKAPTEMQALTAMGGLAKFAAMFVGKQPEEERIAQGFLGLELEARGGSLYVVKVLEGSPAHAAKVETGDRIVKLAGKKVFTSRDAHESIAKTKRGDSVSVNLSRGGMSIDLNIIAGEGF